MTEAVDILVARIVKNPSEEGFRAKPYNDDTGATVTCRPSGNLTWLYGLNLETAGSPALGQMILRWWIQTQVETPLLVLSWYTSLDANRASAILDAAYNMGVTGLLEFHQMIAALALTPADYVTAAAELMNSQSARQRPSRYKLLADILRTGLLPEEFKA